MDIHLHRLIMFVLVELLSIFLYISAALILRWTFNIGPITPMTFNRLIIEGYYYPIIYEMSIGVWLSYLIHERHDIPNVRFHAEFAGFIRFFLFLVTRYAELNPSSSFNKFQVRSFKYVCNFSTPYNYDLIHM